MRIAKILIASLIIFWCILPSLAEGYNVLVIPQSCVDTSYKYNIGNIDFEELLVKKFVTKMEDGDIAYAPTLSVLKISILNNPYLHKDGLKLMDNVNILSNAYGVPRVLLVSSKLEMQTASQQKALWEKLGLPVIIRPEENFRVVTSVKLLNTKDNEVIYNNIFYKNMSASDVKNIDAYYDELIPKVFETLRDSKQTHAIMVGSGVNIEVSDDKKSDYYEYEPMISSKTRLKTIGNTDKNILTKNTKVYNKKVKTDLEPKEQFDNNKAIEASKKAKNGFLFRFNVMNIDKIIDAIKNENNAKPKQYVVKN